MDAKKKVADKIFNRYNFRILNSVTFVVIIMVVFLYQFFPVRQYLMENVLGMGDICSGTYNSHSNLDKISSIDQLMVETNSTKIPFNDKLTVVTAYFNLGRFQKGKYVFTRSLYRQWMTIFASIDNPLIIFIDSEYDLHFFHSIRSNLPENLTRLIRANRSELWAFRIEKRIAEIYKIPGYPKHHPNTVLPAYSSAMHAKYEVMQRAIQANPFHTKYFCWLDIGFFRDLVSPDSVKNCVYVKPKGLSKFRLELPQGFSLDSVAYTEVYRRDPNKSPKDIIYGNHVWLCGCYFVGEHRVLYRWTQEYQNATMTLLAKNLMSTDQQVIYSMFNAMNPKTKIQTYAGDGRYDRYFHLGYISRKTL